MNATLSRKRRWRSTPAQRAEWVRRFAQSGQSQRAFAQRHRLGLATLQKWIAQLRSQPTHTPLNAVPTTAALWQELPLPKASSAPAWAVQIERADGVRLSVSPGVDPQWLAQLWRGLAC